VAVSPTGIASAEAWGTPALAARITLSPSGIASAEAWGTPALTIGAVTLSPSGIASAEAWGTPALSAVVVLSPTGIASAEAWGTPTLTATATISPSGIASGEAWGTPALTAGAVTLLPGGIPSNEAWGTPTLTAGALVISPSGIPSAEAWGTPSLVPAVVVVSPTGIVSEEAWGTPTLTAVASIFDQIVYVTGIPSEEAFGITFLRGGHIPVTLKKRIHDALVTAAKMGTFIEVTYDKDLDTLTQGLQCQPGSIECNETTDAFKVDESFTRRFKQDYQRWNWELTLRFAQEVILERFERALADNPICLKRIPGEEDRQVHVLLVDSNYNHPPKQGGSNGTRVRYRFQAGISR
jgi:hypothetical protein